jgi:hypothetical protein
MLIQVVPTIKLNVMIMMHVLIITVKKTVVVSILLLIVMIMMLVPMIHAINKQVANISRFLAMIEMNALKMDVVLLQVVLMIIFHVMIKTNVHPILAAHQKVVYIMM